MRKTYDINEAAEFLKTHPETVRELAAVGEIPAAQVGKAYVFMEDDLIDYLRAQVRAQTTARRQRAEQESTRADQPMIRRLRADRRRKKPLPELPEIPTS